MMLHASDHSIDIGSIHSTTYINSLTHTYSHTRIHRYTLAHTLTHTHIHTHTHTHTHCGVWGKHVTEMRILFRLHCNFKHSHRRRGGDGGEFVATQPDSAVWEHNHPLSNELMHACARTHTHTHTHTHARTCAQSPRARTHTNIVRAHTCTHAHAENCGNLHRWVQTLPWLIPTKH